MANNARLVINSSLPIGVLATMGAEVLLNFPSPASFSAATRNSYSRPLASPVTLKFVFLICFRVALSHLVPLVSLISRM